MEAIDSIDQNLLRLLQADGRATYSELAGRVGLSVAATKRRIDRLCAAGVITGFTALVDQTKLGWAVEAFTEVRYVGTTPPEDMLRAMSEIPEVAAAYTIAGDPDVLVKLRARDNRHLQNVIERLRRGRATGTKSMIVLDAYRREG
ncbi:Lrp/AsnC family transcriptional regulator [Hoyosella altamirensis]|uniref:DNA-binding Lrp family transcriptional regulator n=1 Tax=Hoyosella altamirensis TaxID=616997 RepID=A0A839RR30_9ACTN|nr:Lrp/AsnC family transcriptional regulator [Hoyosella altamirensis]MBB3038331.1 DNA-binding Lrp family transcriptional regulator [Hoyosella altamirensis]